MRSAFVTPTTAMLFSTLDFAFLRRQNSNVSNFRTSRPLQGAIPSLPGRSRFCGIEVKLETVCLSFWPSCKLTLQSTGCPTGVLQCTALKIVPKSTHYTAHCTEKYTAHYTALCTALQTFLQCALHCTAQRTTGHPALSYYGFIDDCITGLTSPIPFLTFYFNHSLLQSSPICHPRHHCLI